MHRVGFVFDRILNVCNVLAALSVFVVTLSVVAQVVMRYFFNFAIMGVIEVSGYALLYMTFLGAAWVMKEKGHVTMDLVVGKLAPRSRAMWDFVLSITGAVLWLLITWFGFKLTWQYYKIHYFVSGGIDTPAYIVLIVIPLGGLLLALQLLRDARGQWRTARAPAEAKKM